MIAPVEAGLGGKAIANIGDRPRRHGSAQSPRRCRAGVGVPPLAGADCWPGRDAGGIGPALGRPECGAWEGAACGCECPGEGFSFGTPGSPLRQWKKAVGVADTPFGVGPGGSAPLPGAVTWSRAMHPRPMPRHPSETPPGPAKAGCGGWAERITHMVHVVKSDLMPARGWSRCCCATPSAAPTRPSTTACVFRRRRGGLPGRRCCCRCVRGRRGQRGVRRSGPFRWRA